MHTHVKRMPYIYLRLHTIDRWCSAPQVFQMDLARDAFATVRPGWVWSKLGRSKFHFDPQVLSCLVQAKREPSNLYGAWHAWQTRTPDRLAMFGCWHRLDDWTVEDVVRWSLTTTLSPEVSLRMIVLLLCVLMVWYGLMFFFLSNLSTYVTMNLGPRT